MSILKNGNSVNLELIIAETLKAVLAADPSPLIYLDKNQHWYMAVIESDKQDIGMYETILPPIWVRISRVLHKSDALQIPVYADTWYHTRLGCISLDQFVNASIYCYENYNDLWQNILDASATRENYLDYFTHVLNLSI
jgi:hypothetical protein